MFSADFQEECTEVLSTDYQDGLSNRAVAHNQGLRTSPSLAAVVVGWD